MNAIFLLETVKLTKVEGRQMLRGTLFFRFQCAWCNQSGDMTIPYFRPADMFIFTCPHCRQGLAFLAQDIDERVLSLGCDSYMIIGDGWINVFQFEDITSLHETLDEMALVGGLGTSLLEFLGEGEMPGKKSGPITDRELEDFKLMLSQKTFQLP